MEVLKASQPPGNIFLFIAAQIRVKNKNMSSILYCMYLGVGLEFNHLFGFGVLDAGAMVALAKQWKTVPAR
jgi:hypothetical protein